MPLLHSAPPVRRARALRVAALASALLFAAACDDATAPPNTEPVDSEALSEILARRFFQADFALQVLGSPSLSEGTPELTQDPNAQRTRTIAFRDAAGQLQETYDPLTTDTMEVRTTEQVEFQVFGGSALYRYSTAQASRLEFSGLLGVEDTRLLEGTSEGRVVTTTSGPPATKHVDITTRDSIIGLVLPVPPAGTTTRIIPLAGLLVHERNGTFQENGRLVRNGHARITIRYDGTTTALVTVERDGKRSTCSRDLVALTLTCTDASVAPALR